MVVMEGQARKADDDMRLGALCAFCNTFPADNILVHDVNLLLDNSEGF
jgi:hypothetical protein